MQISVSGKQIDIGTALSEYVEVELRGSVKKYFEHAVSANVVLSKLRHNFSASIIVNDGTGVHQLIKATGDGGDAYSAFDHALERIENQLRRYKGKIKDHHKEKLGRDISADAIMGTKYVLSGSDEEENASGGDTPIIIAEKPAHIETLSVSDAVMRMDLGELPAVMFLNKKTGEMNVIYRREDGNISWIEPSHAAKARKGKHAA